MIVSLCRSVSHSDIISSPLDIERRYIYPPAAAPIFLGGEKSPPDAPPPPGNHVQLPRRRRETPSRPVPSSVWPADGEVRRGELGMPSLA